MFIARVPEFKHYCCLLKSAGGPVEDDVHASDVSAFFKEMRDPAEIMEYKKDIDPKIKMQLAGFMGKMKSVP